MRHDAPSLRHLGVWLHPRRQRRLAAALPADVLLVEARPELGDRLPVFETLIVDPLATGQVDTAGVLAVCQRWRNVPTLVYTELATGVASALLTLGREGLRRVAIERLDDGPAALRETLAALRMEGVQLRGLALVERAVGGLPPALRETLATTLQRPAAVQSVTTLADRCGRHRRSLERWLRREGLPPAADLLALARVAAAYVHLHGSDAPVADAARRLGFATQRTLSEHARVLAGLPLRELRRLPPEQFVDAVRRMRWRERRRASAPHEGPERRMAPNADPRMESVAASTGTR